MPPNFAVDTLYFLHRSRAGVLLFGETGYDMHIAAPCFAVGAPN